MSIGSDVARSLGAYAKALVVNAAVTVLLFVAGFAIVGMPWWLLTGMACGLLNLTPQLGPVLSLALALLIQLFASSEWLRLGAVAAVWLAVQIIDGFVLSPRAASKSGINPFASIILVLAAGLLFGPLGVILAVPVAAVLLIVFRTLRSR